MLRTPAWVSLILSGTILASGLIVLTPDYVSAQDDPVADSIKQSEAFKAMEAAADSARRATPRRRENAGNKQAAADTTKPVGDSAAATKTLEASGETAAKSVPDTTIKAVSDSIPADSNAIKAASVPDTTSKQAVVPPARPVDPTAPYKDIEFADNEKPRVIIETSMGKVILELWPDVAPKHCQNFVYQVMNGFYDSLTIHRIVPGFLIQGGDPEGTGTGGPGYKVPAELSPKQLHEEGTLSMARRVDPDHKSGAPEKPEYLNSAGSQFFICLARTASLDGKYTVFGKVVEGLDVIHSIEKVPTQRERPVAPVYMTRVYVEPRA